MMNRADAVQSLIQRAPGLIRQARLGDQNASSVLRTIGEMARMGHPGAKAVAMAIANHIEGERVGFGGRSLVPHAASKGHRKAKGVTGAVAKAKAHALALAKARAASHKVGQSAIAPQGSAPQSQGGGDDSGSDGGGGGGGDDSPDDGSDDSSVDDTTDAAINGEPNALAIVKHVFADAHAGKPEAQALAKAMHEYIRKSRMHGKGAVATVVGLANGPALTKERLHRIGAQFGAEAAKDYYVGLRNPHANIPANISQERASCIRTGQCVGIARQLQLSRLRNAELRRLHPTIGYEAGE